MRSRLQRLLLRHMPIGYKLLVHFLLITILPSMALGVVTGWAVDRIIEKQTNTNTLQLISKVNRSLEFYVSNVQNTTYLISFNPEIQRFLSDERTSKYMAKGQTGYEARRFLQGFTTLHSEMAGIMVVNARGESKQRYVRPLLREFDV